MKQPECSADKNSFMVRFRSSSIEKPVQPAKLRLTERQRKCFEYLREHGAITSAQYSKLFHITVRQARRNLDVLQEMKLVVIEGSGPSTRYVMSD